MHSILKKLLNLTREVNQVNLQDLKAGHQLENHQPRVGNLTSLTRQQNAK